MYDCFNHMNRFVRETAFLATEAICLALEGTEELVGMAEELAERLRDGLSDNWSQVSFCPYATFRKYLIYADHMVGGCFSQEP
jgi:hypothetical protein